jgi:uncharacterized membrane protein
LTHSLFLAVGYSVACALWWATSRVVPLWRNPPRPTFTKPWRDVMWVLLGIVGTLALGQLWSAGIKLQAEGAMGSLAESVNQIVIFAPIMLVPILRKDGWASAWIQPHALLLRVLIGVAFALVALFLFSQLEAGAPSYGDTLRGVFAPSKAHLAVQVLLEDLAIAILFVRLAAAVGERKAIVAVAVLFAAAHIPAMLSQGASASELIGLVRDFGLGVIVLGTAWRSADIMWLWPVHFALDMTQFLGGS